MATAVLGVQENVRPSWIVSARADNLWFTAGGVAFAYLFWALWRFTHVPLILLVAIRAIVFDETHGFATISRTYLDAQERQRRGRWLWGSLAFFLAIGPVLIFLHLGNLLELATVIWGYYHVFKQHYGFMIRNQIVFSFFAAPGLLHYWVDGHIWKMRSDPDLRTYLHL